MIWTKNYCQNAQIPYTMYGIFKLVPIFELGHLTTYEEYIDERICYGLITIG